MADKKSKKSVLLKDELDFIFKNFDLNFNSTGKNFLKKLAKDEKKIDYNNLFFSIDNEPVAKDVDFLKEFGTLYDLLIYLLGNNKRITISLKDQSKFFEAITLLETINLGIKDDIKDDKMKNKKRKFLQNKRVF